MFSYYVLETSQLHSVESFQPHIYRVIYTFMKIVYETIKKCTRRGVSWALFPTYETGDAVFSPSNRAY